MDNDAFRSLLSQPREVKRASERLAGGEGGAGAAGGDKKKREGGKGGGHFKKRDGKHAAQAEGGGSEGEEDKNPYRDRAAERRKGINPDYEEDDVLAVGGLEAMTSVFIAPGIENMTEEERKRLEIENSKYLGGDERNTHRVKGLDYALLNKVRSQMHDQEFEELTADLPASGSAQTKGSAQQAAAPAPAQPVKEQMNFSTALGRSIYSAVFEPPRGNVAENFLPKRMCFVFELGDDVPAPDVPTTVHRAKEDCPPVQETLMGAMDTQVLERFSRIMSYLRVSTSSKHGRRLKKQERQHILQGLLKGEINLEQAQKEEERRVKELEEEERREEERLLRAAQGLTGTGRAGGRSKAAVDDEDIFGDAGTDYVPTTVQRQAGTGAVVGAPPGPKPRFNEDEIFGDLPPVAQHGGERLPAAMPAAEYGLLAGTGIAPPPPPPPAPGEDSHAYYHHYYASYGYQFDPLSQTYIPVAGDLYGPPRPSAYVEEDRPSAPVDPRNLSKEAKDLGLASVFRQGDASLWRKRKLTEEEKKNLLVEDDEDEMEQLYAETVVDPTEDISDAALLKMRLHSVQQDFYDDDDDDEDKKKMDGSKPEKSRYDFATEDEWQRYKMQQEANPKAAFQFGMKKGDGRLNTKDLSKQKDAKIGSQLNQIRNVMKEKGWEKDDVAFVNPEKKARKEAGGKREAVPSETPAPERNKRLRI